MSDLLRRRILTSSGGVLGTFYVDIQGNSTLTVDFEIGMTWRQFCDSLYNDNVSDYSTFWISDGDVVYLNYGESTVTYTVGDGITDTISAAATIIPDFTYYTQEPEGIEEDEGSGGEVNPEGEDPSGNEGGGSTSEGEGSEPESES